MYRSVQPLISSSRFSYPLQSPELGSVISSGTSASLLHPKKHTAKLFTVSILLPWKHEKHDCFLFPAFFKPLLRKAPALMPGHIVSHVAA